MEAKQQYIKKIVEDIKNTVQKYGEVIYRSKSPMVLYGKRYYTRIHIGKILSDTELKDTRLLRIDYLKTNDTIVLVITKPQ